jgi:tetratricopeptide (TPR) repeat protein
LDWLEKLNTKEMEQAKKVIEENRLVTPKKTKKQSDDEIPADCIPKDTGSATRNPLTPPRHPSSNLSRPLPPTFATKKEAIGNGWNAKGVQKAKCEHWEEALACWEKALEIRLEVFGEVHKDVANTLNNMGVALGRLERHSEAMELLERALKVRTEIYGKKHLEIAATLHNIGNVLHQMDDYSGALQCFLETRRIQEEVLGDKDIQVARTLNAIGHLHFECAQAYKKACEAYTEARDVFLRAGINEDNEELQNTYLDIAEVEQLLRSD